MGLGTRKRALAPSRGEDRSSSSGRRCVADRTAALQRRRDAGDLTDEEMEVEVEKLAEDLRLVGEADAAADAA